MNNIKFIVKALISLVSRPEDFWGYLAHAKTKEISPDYMQQNYYLPLLGAMALVVFLCSGIYSPDKEGVFDLQQGMVQMVPVLVAYFVGPYIAMLVVRILLKRVFHEPNPDRERLHIFVFYSSSFLVALEILLAIIPTIRFFQFIGYYLIYITWGAGGIYIRLRDSNQRWLFCFLSFLAIYFSPVIIVRLLHTMQG